MSNPYKGIDDHCYWSRGVMRVAPGLIDPVVRSERIMPEDKVVTLGSCFAQHISKHLMRRGYNYYIVERPEPDLSSKEAERLGYNIFSARFGNVYTVEQALQLFKRAFGQFNPAEQYWKKGERWCSPFRPNIEPEGYITPDMVISADAEHLGNVARMFREANWIIFTLGLTEAWRSKADGAVFPLAPGVAGGTFSLECHEFVNFSVKENTKSFAELINAVRSVNPGAKFVVTVSPVPLVATYEKRHVMVSTCYSKSVLRVVAGEIENMFPDVYYFPSYEVITSHATSDRYFKNDLRQINWFGVSHVMRLFDRHFLDKAECAQLRHSTNIKAKESVDIICDEELIEAAIELSGVAKHVKYG